MNRTIIWAWCFMALTISACNHTSEQGGRLLEQDTVPVTLLSLTEHAIQAPIHASGTFTTDDETILSFKTGGVIQSIPVDEGDRVTAGQVLARLNLAEVDAAVQQARLAHEKATRDYERALGLYRDSVATQEQLQNARTARDMAAQQLRAARFNKNQAEIRAPLSGYVLKRFVNEGQIVGPGTPVLLINGAATADWFVKVGVTDKQWSSIQVGDPATVSSDMRSGSEIDASVYKKSEGVDASSGMFIITLKIKSASKQDLAAGAFAKAVIRPAQSGTGWAIPYDALLEGDRGTGYVFVTNDKRTVQKVKVQIADIQRDQVLIKSGLEDAKFLITSGSAYLNAGSIIKSIKP